MATQVISGSHCPLARRSSGRPSGRPVAFAALCVFLAVSNNPTWAQQTPKKSPPAQAAGKGGSVANQKATDTSKSDPTAVNHYADAANFYNNGAFELAVEEWQKLIKDYPKDPLVSKASHYLGVCYMQQAKPNYPAAVAVFARALADAKLDVRDESLINLAWCQFMQARSTEGDEASQRKLFEQSKESFADYIKSYPQGSAMDQVLFFSGEIEYSLGNSKKATSYYDQLLRNKSLASSRWRPEAQYAMGVALEQLKQDAQARDYYQTFLKENPDSKLRRDVTMRLADVFLRTGNPTEAEKLLRQEGDQANSAFADYATLRLGQALMEQKKYAEAAAVFESLVTKFPKSEHVSMAQLSSGQMYFRNGQFPEAAKQLRQVLKAKDTKAAEAAHLLAMTMQRLPNSEEAISMLQEALKWADKTPSAVTLRMDLADAISAIPSRMDESREVYEKIASDFPDDPLAPRAAYNAAFTALQLGKIADARGWSEIFLKKYPQDPLRSDVVYIGSEAMLQQGQHAAAIEALSKLIDNDKANPTQPIWNLRLSMAYYLSGKYQEAIKLLETKKSIFTDAPQRAEAESIMGSCYLFLEKPAEAIAQFQASQKTSDKWVRADEVLLLLSQAYQRQNDPTASQKTLESLIARYPQSRLRYQARYRIAQIQAAGQEYDKAIANYDAILKEPAAANLHDFAKYGVASLLIKQDKFEEGLKALQPLLEAGRTDSLGVETQLAQAICQRKLGKLDDALATLDKYFEAKPTGLLLANGLYEAGLAQIEKGQVDKAIESFQRVLADVPDYPSKDKILFELGWAWADKQEPEKSVSQFQQLTKSFPQSKFVWKANFQVAQHLFDTKEYDKAAPLYASVKASSEDSVLKEKANYKLGWCLFQRQKYGEASKEFRAQADNYPSGSLIVDAQFMLAECLFKQDKFAEALGGYQVARQLLEKNSQSDVSEQVRSLIYLHGGQCLLEQKKWADAEKWLREIITRYPSSPYLPQVIYELGRTKQGLNQIDEALRLFGEVAEKYRDENAARARFMMGELHFAQRQFDKAISQFNRCMFGYGAERAENPVKNWQARSGLEAGRCSEVLVQDLKGDAREKALKMAKDSYKYVIDNHATHEVVKQAQVRLDALNKLR